MHSHYHTPVLPHVLRCAVSGTLIPRKGSVVTYGVTLTNGATVVPSGSYLQFSFSNSVTPDSMQCDQGAATSATVLKINTALAALNSINCNFTLTISQSQAENGGTDAFTLNAAWTDGSSALSNTFHVVSSVSFSALTVNSGSMLATDGAQPASVAGPYVTGEQ